jgi:hypothetical protein
MHQSWPPLQASGPHCPSYHYDFKISFGTLLFQGPRLSGFPVTYVEDNGVQGLKLAVGA